MRKIFYSLAIVFGILLSGSFSFQDSFGTECYAPNFEKNFEEADVVFFGTATEIVHSAIQGDSFTEVGNVTFDVLNTWKGETSDIVVVKSELNPFYCGVPFQSDENYLVYANESDGVFFTSANFGTQSFSEVLNLYQGYDVWPAKIIEQKEKCLEKRLDLAAQNANISEGNKKFLPPKLQLLCESPPNLVQCNKGLELIFKNDDSPACVNPATAEKLIERGWANPTIKIISELNTNLEKDYRETGSVDNVIGIRGIVFDNGTSILDPWYKFEDKPDVDINNSGEIIVLYLDTNQNIIAQTGFDLNRGFTHSVTTFDLGSFALRIPVVDKMDQIILQRDGQTVAIRQISPNDPTVTLLTPNGGELFIQGDIIDVTWQSSDLDGDEIFHILEFSQDGGSNWLTLVVDLIGNQFNFTAPQNIQSDLMLIRVIAMDGINTSEDISDSFFAISR